MDQRTAVFQGTPRDQGLGRMRCQPAFPLGEQLVDLIVIDEVVLVVVKNRYEYVDMAQQISEPNFRLQAEVKDQARAGVVER